MYIYIRYIETDKPFH